MMKINYLGIALALVMGFTGFQTKLNAQTVVFDQEIYWEWPTAGNTYGGYSFYWWHRNEGVVNINFGNMSSTDWTSPNNYYNGEFTLRFEILDQPTSKPFEVQFGIWQDKSKGNDHPETVSGRQYVSGGNGTVINTSLGSPNGWWNRMPGDPVDFSRPEDFYRIGIVLWNVDPYLCIPMGTDWNASGCPEFQADFFPMRARVTVLAYPSSSVPTHQITFKVKDEGGNNVEGANVNISGNNLTTNASGEAYIDMQNGTYSYTVSKGGYNNTSGSVSVNGSNVTENVTLSSTPQSYTVTFNVKDQGGNNIEGANININGTDISTNSGGQAFIDLPDGNYGFTISKSGFNNASGSVNVSGADKTVNTTLSKPKYTVTFSVKDGGGNAIEGANVAVNGSNISTNSSGQAFIDLENGDYSYTVSKSGYNNSSGSVNVSGSDKTENVTLSQPTYTVTFSVKDESAAAVEGASISVNGNNLSTDGSGQATIELVNGSYDYTVSKDGFGNASGSVNVSGSDITENVTLSPSSYTVTFNVSDESTDPVEGATVSINGSNLTTDATGHASITLVNDSYDYTVSKNGYNSETGTVVVSGSNVTENVTLSPATYTVSFTVNDEGASPVEGANIAINGNNLATDASGQASISLVNGTYSYTVTKNGFNEESGDVSVSGSGVSENVTLTVPTYTLTFNVTDAGANPVEGANVAINGTDLTTDASGQATISLPDGSFNYTVSKTTYSNASGTINISGSDITEDVTLSIISYSVLFIVTNESANPIEGATVSVNGSNLTTDSNGRVTVELPDGSHGYTVTATGYSDKNGSVVVAGENKAEFVTMTSNIFMVSFTVSDNNANAVEGASISINENSMMTDASGQASIELMNGSYIYTVTKDGYKEKTGTVVVAGASVNEEVTVQIVTSTLSLDIANVDIFPNPGSGIFTISYSSEFKANTRFAVFSITGEKVYSYTNPTSVDEILLNLTNVSKGVYFLRINSGDESLTKRLIVQ